MSPLIDLLIRIKNGYLAGKPHAVSPYSKFLYLILVKLVSLKFIESIEVIEDKIKTIKIKKYLL